MDRFLTFKKQITDASATTQISSLTLRLNLGLSTDHQQFNSINMNPQQPHELLFAGLQQLMRLLCL